MWVKVHVLKIIYNEVLDTYEKIAYIIIYVGKIVGMAAIFF